MLARLPLDVQIDAPAAPRVAPRGAGVTAGALARVVCDMARRSPRDLGPAQALPGRRLPLGVLRRLEEPLPPLVLDERVRQPHEDPRVPAPPRHAGRSERRAASG